PAKARTTSRVEFTDHAREQQKEEEARQRRERAKEAVPFGKKRKDVGYTAPKFFTVQKRSRRVTVARDPFSTDRQLNVPRGGAFQLKKSDRKTTQFQEFGKGDRNWTAPKKFEVKAREKNPTQFWSPPPAKSATDDARRRRRRREGSDSPGRRQKGRESSTDSGLGTGDKEGDDGTSTDEKAPLSGGGDGEDKPEVVTAEEGEGDVTDSPQKPRRREIVKKTRGEKQAATPPQSPKRLPSPPVFKRRVSPPPTPPSPPESPALPEAPLPQLDLDLPTVPDLPELQDREPEKRKQKLKFTVEPPPQLQTQDIPKKRRAAPKVRIIPKNLSRPRKSRPAEAPVTSEEMQNIQDPLDFLAKYCIINPDRIPFYEIIFESTVAEQTPRYSKSPAKDSQPNEQSQEENPTEDGPGEDGKKKSGSSKSRKSSKKSKPGDTNPDIRPGLFAADRGMYLDKPVMTLEEQHLEKLIYTLDLLQDKMTTLGSQLADLDVQRTRFIATKARFLFPEVTAPDYFPKLKKKKKGKKGKKEATMDLPTRKLGPHDITDDVICARLDDKMMNE
ncbi:hypothetical protein EGW08_008767, partial [Elysia chlorotica]